MDKSREALQIVLAQPRSHCFHRLLELQEILFDDIPDLIEIHAHVVVNQYVSKTGYTASGHVWILPQELWRQALDGLTDHFEVPNDGILQDVRLHVSLTPFLGAVLDAPDALCDVIEVHASRSSAVTARQPPEARARGCAGEATAR